MITLIFGDSISWGAFDYQNGGWAEKLKKIGFKKEDFVYNCSISGNTSEDILSRMSDEIDYRLDPEDDLRIIFAFGINDSAYRGRNYVTSIQMFVNNIEKIIAIAKKYTDDICFIGLTCVDEEKTNPVSWADLSYVNDDIREFNSEMKLIVEKEKIKFVDVNELLSKNDLLDGVHPNTSGHSILLNAIVKSTSE